MQKKSSNLGVAILLMISIFSGESYSFKAADKPPNIIIIFMDDMGYGDPECYNGLLYHTPNIDKLAAEGMRFTNFYAAEAVCSASRAGLLTGCYPNRVGIYSALFPWSEIALNPKEETIASSLKKAGYNTAMIGKWHLGCKPPYLPIHYGFDEFFGLPYSNDMWAVDYSGRPINDTTNWKSKFPPLPLLEGDKPVKYIKTLDDQATLTTTYTQHAIEYIKKNKSHPFFLYLAHSMPHVPIAASPAFKGKSKEGLFGDVMMEIDWSVGEIMKALDKNGLAENTLIIFTSDNGPWLRFGNHAGNGGGLREGKTTTWEGGQREPCIMRWTEKIPAGTVCNKIASTIDLFPTIANICKAPLPKEKIDDVDILPLLLNDANANPRDEFAYYSPEQGNNSLEAIRKGQWKLIFAHSYQTFKRDSIGHNGFPAPVMRAKSDFALYDLRTDPGETHDVKAFYPEVVKELDEIANKYRQTLGDDLTNMPCKECRDDAKINL